MIIFTSYRHELREMTELYSHDRVYCDSWKKDAVAVMSKTWEC